MLTITAMTGNLVETVRVASSIHVYPGYISHQKTLESCSGKTGSGLTAEAMSVDAICGIRQRADIFRSGGQTR